MTVNAKIRAVNYNSIRTKVVNVLGPGSADFGYGGIVRSAEVTEENKITVAQWGNLYYDIVNCYIHQTGALPPAIAEVNEGNIIKSDADSTSFNGAISGTTLIVYQQNSATSMVAIGQTLTSGGGSGLSIVDRLENLPITITGFTSKTIFSSATNPESGSFLVTYAIAAQPVALPVGASPAVGPLGENTLVTISGNSNTNYNGTFPITASTTNSITVKYSSDPDKTTVSAFVLDGSVGTTLKVQNTTTILPGQTISGAGFTSGLTVVSILDSSTLIISGTPAEIPADGGTLTFSFSYGTGTTTFRVDKNNPWGYSTWTLNGSRTVAYSAMTAANSSTPHPYLQYDTFANTLVANRFAVHSSQAISVFKANTSQTWPGVYGADWNGTIKSRVTVTFTSATAARYFFNNGGEIRFSSSRPNNGSTRAQDTTWSSLLTAAGAKAFGGAKPGTGVSPANGLNYYRLSNNYQEWTSSTASSPYTQNRWRINARSPGVANNSTGTARIIEFEVEWIDGYADPGNYFLDVPQDVDKVTGSIILSVSTLEASTILQPAGTGTLTVESPGVEIGEIFPSASQPSPVYSIVPSTTSVDEGSSVVFTITNNQISDGNMYLKFIGTYNSGVEAIVTLSNFTGTYTVSPAADLTTETQQSFYLQMRTGNQFGNLVATSATVTVNDTSVYPISNLSVAVYGAGGGGGAQWFCPSWGSGGAGGGSGGYTTGNISVITGTALSVSVGSGGAGGGYVLCASGPGSGGGSSSIGAFTATGGEGGRSDLWSPGPGGVGGTPNGVQGAGGVFGSASPGAGGNNGTGYGSGGGGGSYSSGAPGGNGAVVVSFPGDFRFTSVTGIPFSVSVSGGRTTYTFSPGSGTIVV